MAKPSVKTQNKMLRRRLLGLKSKCYGYGKLNNIELMLVIHNRVKKDYYTYLSSDRVKSWANIEHIVSRSIEVYFSSF
jgi:hypothetical protein